MKDKNPAVVNDEVTIISTGVVLEGKLASKGNLRIDGIINGDIQANGNVTIGGKGEINGEVQAQVIILGGKISGSIKAAEKVVLESTAVLKGDLISKILVVEAGAKFDGQSRMGGSELPAQKKPSPEITEK